jgi:hypothetical protein
MADIGSSGSNYFEIVRTSITTANTWQTFEPPDWVRRVVVLNEHASEDLLLADPSVEAGAINTGVDDYCTIGAGAGLALNLAPGAYFEDLREVPDDRRIIVLTRAANAGSRDVAMVLEG